MAATYSGGMPHPSGEGCRHGRSGLVGHTCHRSARVRRDGGEATAALDLHIAGLAISGGGIRSATFALGVIQALAHLKFLRRFDYLSTVSGGGYIGSWLSAWLRREEASPTWNRSLLPVGSTRARPSGGCCRRPSRRRRARNDSSISGPIATTSRRELGVLTPDTWTILAIYFRNILINLLMLLPATVALLLAARFFVVWPFVSAVAAGPQDFGSPRRRRSSRACRGSWIARHVRSGPIRSSWRNCGGWRRWPKERMSDLPIRARCRFPEPKPMSEARLVRKVVVPIVLAAGDHGVGLSSARPASPPFPRARTPK